MIKQLVLGCIFIIALAACSAAPAPQPDAPTSAPTQAPTLPPAPAATLPAASTPTPDQPMAARVNGAPVYLSVFEREVAQRVQALKMQGINLDTPDGQAALTTVRAQALDMLIQNELIAQAASQLGLSVSEADVEAVIQQDINNIGGLDAFNAWLSNNGTTLEEHRAGQRTSMLNNAVRDRVTAGVSPNAEQVHARYILLLTEQEAGQVAGMLQAGGDFAALAQQYSKDSVTAPGGGDLGWFPRGSWISPALEEAAFNLQPGQVSGVVKSEFAGEVVYLIVQVLERDPARPLSVEHLGRLQQQAFQQWYEELKTKSHIELFVTP